MDASKSQPCASKTAFVVFSRHDNSVGTVFQMARAPSAIDLLRSGMIRSTSNSSRMPSPVHSGQAPWGELNENERGSSSSNVVPSYAHE